MGKTNKRNVNAVKNKSLNKIVSKSKRKKINQQLKVTASTWQEDDIDV